MFEANLVYAKQETKFETRQTCKQTVKHLLRQQEIHSSDDHEIRLHTITFLNPRTVRETVQKSHFISSLRSVGTIEKLKRAGPRTGYHFDRRLESKVLKTYRGWGALSASKVECHIS